PQLRRERVERAGRGIIKLEAGKLAAPIRAAGHEDRAVGEERHRVPAPWRRHRGDAVKRRARRIPDLRGRDRRPVRLVAAGDEDGAGGKKRGRVAEVAARRRLDAVANRRRVRLVRRLRAWVIAGEKNEQAGEPAKTAIQTRLRVGQARSWAHVSSL